MAVESKVFEGTAGIRFKLTQTQVEKVLFALTVMYEQIKTEVWFGDVYVNGPLKGQYVFQEVALGGAVCFPEKLTGNVYCLDDERLMEGVRLYLERDFEFGKVICSRMWQNPEIANRIVQYALFGEVKYE